VRRPWWAKRSSRKYVDRVCSPDQPTFHGDQTSRARAVSDSVEKSPSLHHRSDVSDFLLSAEIVRGTAHHGVGLGTLGPKNESGVLQISHSCRDCTWFVPSKTNSSGPQEGIKLGIGISGCGISARFARHARATASNYDVGHSSFHLWDRRFLVGSPGRANSGLSNRISYLHDSGWSAAANQFPSSISNHRCDQCARPVDQHQTEYDRDDSQPGG
jgi:hypothetical protein